MHRLARFLHHHALLVFIGFTSLCVGLALVGSFAFGRHLVEAQALQSSQTYLQTIKTSWAIYHDEVVQQLQDVDGVTISDQYQAIDGGIPTSATYTAQLSQKLQKTPGNPQLFLSSIDGVDDDSTDIQDPFQKDALEHFTRSNTQPFYRVDLVEGYWAFNYAEPLIMDGSCVDCHNRLVETEETQPSQHWVVGAVGGVFTIRQPLTSMLKTVNQSVRRVGWAVGCLSAIGLLGGMMINRHHLTLYQKLNDELEQKSIALERLDLTDVLTQVANQRQFTKALHQEWRRVWRQHGHLSLLICDVDYFQQYNREYGSVKGDHCLKAIAQALQRQLKRAGDLVARTKGGEFSILLPETTATEAEEVAAILLDAVHNLKLPHSQSDVSPYVSISIGIASTVPTKAHKPDELVQLAEQALYEDVKVNNRNDFVVKIL